MKPSRAKGIQVRILQEFLPREAQAPNLLQSQDSFASSEHISCNSFGLMNMFGKVLSALQLGNAIILKLLIFIHPMEGIHFTGSVD